MSDLRGMIIERIRTRGPGSFWILDAYYHLISDRVSPSGVTAPWAPRSRQWLR
jgi:hypothetical protein